MSNLTRAKEQWDRGHLSNAILHLIAHLEERRSATPLPPHQHEYFLTGVGPSLTTAQRPIPEQPAETPQSGQSSSVDTEMLEATKPISTTSWSTSFPVNRDGRLAPSHREAMLVWLNSMLEVGAGQEAEIGVTLTSRDLTPPDGSLSPSTEAQVPAASGHAGDAAHRLYGPGVLHNPLSSPSPVAEQREKCFHQWLNHQCINCGLRSGAEGSEG